MNKKKITIIGSCIAVVLVVAIVVGVFLINNTQKPDTTPLLAAYQKTMTHYFGNINFEKFQKMLPNSTFSILCGEDQSSHFLIKADKKQMVNILNSKNEFSNKAIDMQFYVFDKYFAISSNELLSGHAYGFDTDLIDLQLQGSVLMGAQGLDVEAVLNNKQQRLDDFRVSITDMWLIGQTDLANALGDTKAKYEENETQRIERYELNASQAKKLTSAVCGAPASVLEYLARHTEYLMNNDDVYKYQSLINTIYGLADFTKYAESANAVVITIDKTSGMLKSFRFENSEYSAEICFVQDNEKNQIRFTCEENNWTLSCCFENTENSIAYEVDLNADKMFSGTITETEYGFRASVDEILAAGEMQTAAVEFTLTDNINETMELPGCIDIGNMDTETIQHFFEHMLNVYTEGYDEFGDILIFNAENEDETDFIEVPKGNIYQGEIVLVDNDRVTAKIVKVNTETACPSLMFEMTNKLDETLYITTHSMLIQNQTIDMNTGMNVAAGETKVWAIQLTKDNLGFDLEQIDSIYFPRITISTEKNILFEISHRVEFAEIEDVPVTELPETLIYNAAHFKVYADKNTEFTEDGIQTTVYFVNNSSRNIYIEINAGAINDVQGECVEFFPCYANTICKKTLTIKGDFTDMTEQDLQKIVIALYIRDRDESQLTGLQSMEISFVENADG